MDHNSAVHVTSSGDEMRLSRQISAVALSRGRIVRSYLYQISYKHFRVRPLRRMKFRGNLMLLAMSWRMRPCRRMARPNSRLTEHLLFRLVMSMEAAARNARAALNSMRTVNCSDVD